jgi:hypothetical protein
MKLWALPFPLVFYHSEKRFYVRNYGLIALAAWAGKNAARIGKTKWVWAAIAIALYIGSFCALYLFLTFALAKNGSGTSPWLYSAIITPLSFALCWPLINLVLKDRPEDEELPLDHFKEN